MKISAFLAENDLLKLCKFTDYLPALYLTVWRLL